MRARHMLRFLRPLSSSCAFTHWTASRDGRNGEDVPMDPIAILLSPVCEESTSRVMIPWSSAGEIAVFLNRQNQSAPPPQTVWGSYFGTKGARQFEIGALGIVSDVGLSAWPAVES